MKLFLALSALCCSLSFSQEKTPPPNIIFLFADDQRADTIGAHGNPHIKTPHLDQLAAQGFSFRENYCAGSFSGAVCVASRAMLMTGKHWMNLPAGDPRTSWAKAPLLPALLTNEAGYRSHIVGKWHNGLQTLQGAFSEGSSVFMGGMDDHTDFSIQDYQDGKLSAKRPAEEFSSATFATAAVKFIQSAQTEQPFFLYVSFTAPHDPRNPPEKYREMYYQNRPPLPANFLPEHPFINTQSTLGGRDENLGAWPRTKEVVSDQLCEYYGLVTHLDEQVGRIMEALKGSPHADNTIIIYTADHGLAMGSHGLLGKQNIYEHSMKCPLIITGPGISKTKAGQSSQAFTYIHDLYPTVLDLAGVSTPEGVDSNSLLPLISGKADALRESLFLPYQDHQRSIRDERWKLHLYPQVAHQLLYDLHTDPHEINNLATDPAHAEEIKRLTALMETWRTKLGDKSPLTVPNPKPKEAHYNNDKRFPDKWQPKWIRDKYFEGREVRKRKQKEPAK